MFSLCFRSESEDSESAPLSRYFDIQKAKRKRKRHHKKSKKSKWDQNKENKIDFEVVHSSRKAHCRVSAEEACHKKVIDRLLRANACKRIPVPKNGDCFFESICLQLDQQASAISPSVLRTIVCEHLSQHWNSYKQFLPASEDYEANMKILRKPGSWKCAVADCLAGNGQPRPDEVDGLYQRSISLGRSSHIKLVSSLVNCQQLSKTPTSSFESTRTWALWFSRLVGCSGWLSFTLSAKCK